MSFTSREFRDALGCFATGVTLVTTLDEAGEPIAITANSFSSVSLDPPLVLWCLDKGSDRVAAFSNSEHFAINILKETQVDLSNRFATKGSFGMDGIDYETWETGSPIISDALANFDCDVQARHDAGDHIIYVGKVRRISSDPDGGGPLLYCLGGYQGIRQK